jgi:ribosomal protein S18 acetylase RimI-like enzyme
MAPMATDEEAAWCAGLMAADEPWITLGRTFERCMRILQDEAKEVYVARIGPMPVGFCILDMHGPFPGYVQTVCVAPEARRRGIGSAMIAWAEERIFRDSPNVFMCVSSFNPAAQRLYARLGYEVVGTLHGYIVAEHDEILLRKTRGAWSEFARQQRMEAAEPAATQ